MATDTGHARAILASKVKGTNVCNNAGDKIGTVEDIVLDKQSNRIMFAALGFGGFVGLSMVHAGLQRRQGLLRRTAHQGQAGECSGLRP